MSVYSSAPRWLLGAPPQEWGARPLLVIVPPVGRGPEQEIRWLDGASDIDISIVQFPGGGERLFEEPMQDYSHGAAQLAAVWDAYLPKKWAMLGVCSGSFAAMELARHELARDRAPQRLFLCNGRPPGHGVDPDLEVKMASSAIIAMTDDELVEGFVSRGRLPAEDLDPEIRDAVIGAYRSAVVMSASYRWDGPPLDVAAEVWRSATDGVFSASHARAWQRMIVPDIDIFEFPIEREELCRPASPVAQRIRSWLRSDDID